VPDVSDSLLLLPEPQCTARSCRFGNGFWPSIAVVINMFRLPDLEAEENVMCNRL